MSEPRSCSRIGHAVWLLGVAPYDSATWACTFAVMVYSIHFSMQFGCLAWADIIHVSAQPVTPSDGTTASTGWLSASNVCRVTGQAVPTTTSPDENGCVSSPTAPQYLAIIPCCCCRR